MIKKPAAVAFFLAISAALALGEQIETVIQNGHDRPVQTMAVSPDVGLLATGSSGGVVKLWTMEGELVRTFSAYDWDVARVAFGPGGDTLITCSTQDFDVKVWSLEGELLRSFEVGSEDRWRTWAPCVFSPDGALLANDDRGRVEIWSWRGEKLCELVVSSGELSAAAFSADGRCIACVQPDDRIGLWSVQGELIRTFRHGHAEGVSTVAFSPDGRRLATGGWSAGADSPAVVKIWSLEGRPLQELTGLCGGVVSVALSPDGSLVAAGSGMDAAALWSADGRLIRVVDMESGIRAVPELGLEEGSGAVFVACSPDGGSVVTGAADGRVRRLSARDGAVLAHFGPVRSVEVTSVDYSADGTGMAVAWADGTARVFSTAPFSVRARDCSDGPLAGVAFMPDAQGLAVASEDGALRIWRPAHGELETLSASRVRINSLAVSGPAWLAACACGDASVRTYDLEFGGQELTLRRRAESSDPTSLDTLSEIRCVAFSPSGEYLAATDQDNHAMVWTAYGRPVSQIDVRGEGTYWRPTDLEFAPDGSCFATCNDSELHLWSLEGALIRVYGEPLDRVWSAAFSPDGETVAGGMENGDVVLWTTAGDPIRTLQGHHGWVAGLDFSPDGRFLLSGSADTTVRLWDVGSGESLTLIGFDTEDWFVLHSGGRFDCSSGGMRHVRFVKGLQVYKPDQLWDSFFTPGLLARFVQGEKLAPVDAEAALRSMPEVAIGSPTGGAIPAVTGSGTALLEVSAEPSEGGVGRVFLLHNGRVVEEGARGMAVAAESKTSGGSASGRRTHTFRAALLEGENVFQGGAYDHEGTIYGLSPTVRIRWAPSAGTAPSMHVLCCGVGAYRDPNLRLEAPKRDAEAVAAIFEETGRGLFGRVSTTVLTDRRADREGVLAGMEAIVQEIGFSDVLVLYLSGHGFSEQGTYYYLPYDADVTDLRASCISETDLSDFVARVPSRKVVILMDTCHSGEVTRSLGVAAAARGGIEERRLVANLAKSKGIAVFSAASETQAAYEIAELGYGIFTYCLLDAYENKRELIADDGFVRLSRLLGTVNASTRETAHRFLGIEQSPIMYLFGDDFVIGRLP